MGKTKRRTWRKILLVSLAGLVLLGLVLPVLAELEWPAKIQRFERVDPVYTAVVEPGTAQEDLGLPESLRAILPLPEDTDPSTFLQAQPTADLSDGTEHYDYYYYGYVAPAGKDELYEQGELVIYTISYAAEDGQGVGEVAYRVYGSLDGSENTWFACTEDGTLTGVVEDISVGWGCDGYDSQEEGEYIFQANFMKYDYGSARPYAKITVQAQETESTHCDCGLGEDSYSSQHQTSCPFYQPDCTCDLHQNKNVEGHAEDCPWYVEPVPECTCGAQAGEEHKEDCPLYVEEEHCTCSVGEDVFSHEHEETCPFYEELLCTCQLATNIKGYDHDPTCPQYVQAAENCACGTDGQPIDADNFPWAHKPECVNYAPPECMCLEYVDQEVTIPNGHDGTTTEIQPVAQGFAHVHDPDNMSCPLYGKETVSFTKLDEKSFSARRMDGVQSVMAWEDAQKILTAQEEGKILYAPLGKIEVDETSRQAPAVPVNTLSTRAAGLIDTEQNEYMINSTPTSGNVDREVSSGVVVPGTWTDYLNTIWQNKGVAQSDWADANEVAGLTPWNGQSQAISKSGSTWGVSNASQLVYAMTYADDGDTISINQDINLNGAQHNWTRINFTTKSITINGNNHTIYNLGQCLPDSQSSKAGFMTISGSGKNCVIMNVEFSNARVVMTSPDGNSVSSTGLLRSPSTFGGTCTIKGMHVTDSLFFSNGDANSPIHSSLGGTTALNSFVLERSGVSDGFVYGKNHVGSVASFVHKTINRNVYSDNNLLVSLGADSGSVFSCLNGLSTFENCFGSNNEMYVAMTSGGFIGYAGEGAEYKNCFASGKLEGYQWCGGFAGVNSVGGGFEGVSGSSSANLYTSCYSSVLVGLRSESQQIGGFIGATWYNPWLTITQTSVYKDCYAVGEVGDYTTDLAENSTQCGGFWGSEKWHESAGNLPRSQFVNCYYDKQTTAMREWETGVGKDMPGITGVLTTSTENGSGTVAGLADSPGDQGFTGFSDNSQWVYHSQHYPQLAVFANATAEEWGSQELANLVRACSLASTATVFLNTWNYGFDWDENGVRTTDTVNFHARSETSLAHKGDEYTYDTVRDITTDFTASYSTDQGEHTTNWVELIPGGAKTEPVADDEISHTSYGSNITIDPDSGEGTAVHPGVNWYSVEAEYQGQIGRRPLRIVSLMLVEGGEDETIYSGQRYDHRDGVFLHLIDQLVDNLVIGPDNDKVWAYGAHQAYPTNADGSTTKKFYQVPTEDSNFELTQGAWLYTEIWRAEKTADGLGYVKPSAEEEEYYDESIGQYLSPGYSERVTGIGTGNGDTSTEQKWNGEIPFYPGMATQQKYIVSYHWMLEDGRYASDYKIVTVEPGQYDLQINANQWSGDTSLRPQPLANGETLETDLLYLSAAPDENGDIKLEFPQITSASATASNILHGQNATAAWNPKTSDARVYKMQLEFFADDGTSPWNGTLMGQATLEGQNILEPGAEIPVTISYYWVDQETEDNVQGIRYETTQETDVTLTYTVEEDATTGAYYLRLNKLLNIPDWEPQSDPGSTGEGVDAQQAYINDMMFNTRVTLWVAEGADFQFIKTDEEGTPFGADEATFQLYSCQHQHDASCGGLNDPASCTHQHDELAGAESQAGGCWAVEGDTVKTSSTSATGVVTFDKLKSGQYMLAETKTREGYQLPLGQWLIEMDIDTKDVKITAKGEMPPAFAIVEDTEEKLELRLPNYKIMDMPATGGPGTLGLVVGGVVMIGLGVILMIMLWRKPNSGNEK